VTDTRYSVRRAKTEDERSQRVERVNVPAPVTPESKWQVEVDDVRVVLRKDATEIELTLDEARAIAEAILSR